MNLSEIWSLIWAELLGHKLCLLEQQHPPPLFFFFGVSCGGCQLSIAPTNILFSADYYKERDSWVLQLVKVFGFCLLGVWWFCLRKWCYEEAVGLLTKHLRDWISDSSCVGMVWHKVNTPFVMEGSREAFSVQCFLWYRTDLFGTWHWEYFLAYVLNEEH